MYEFYQTRVPEKVLKQSRKDLHNIYDLIPETEGCMENLPTCGAWCCLAPETPVYTAFGPVPIKDIFVGQSVMTKGGWKRVTHAASKMVDKPVVRVATCYGREMELTGDHLVYAEYVERKDRYVQSEPQFIAACDLKPKKANTGGHYVVFPKASWSHDAGGMVILDLREYIPYAHFSTETDRQEFVYASKRKKGVGIPRQIILDERWSRILGLFLAEGSFDDSQLNFHFSTDETSLHEEIKAFAAALGLRCSWRRTHGKSFTMRIFSRVLHSLFREICGSGCDKKRLHPRVLDLITTSRKLTQSFHDGVYAGDGGKKSAEKDIYSYTTTSGELASQMMFVNHLLGRFVGVSKTTPVFRKPVYTLVDDQSGKYKDYIETDKDWRVPVRSVEVTNYVGLVFDIEVDGEHSFLTEAGEVHNCEHQNPSVLYAEWLNTYWRISHEWSKERLSDLFLRAVETYVSDKPTKGCVFWDRKSKQCSQHLTRPFNCRTYGQVPEEEFKPRYEQLKVLYADKPGAVIRDQCSLVKTVGKKPTSQEMGEWFEQLKIIERDVLGPHAGPLITDKDGGTYRTYHDHILLQMAPPTFLQKLTDLRKNASETEKDDFLKQLKVDLEEKLNAVEEDNRGRDSVPARK